MNLLYGNPDALFQSMVEDYLKGHHCSEMIFLKLGQYYDRTFDTGLMKLATGFGGGIAESADACGALIGGVMLIGYLHGRTSLGESQKECWRYCRLYRDRFLRELGGTTCYYFTKGQFNPANHRKCATVVTNAARILLDILPAPSPKESSSP